MCVKKRLFDWLIKRVSITKQYMKPLTLRASALHTALISTLFGKFKPEVMLKSAWKTKGRLENDRALGKNDRVQEKTTALRPVV